MFSFANVGSHGEIIFYRKFLSLLKKHQPKTDRKRCTSHGKEAHLLRKMERKTSKLTEQPQRKTGLAIMEITRGETWNNPSVPPALGALSQRSN